MSFFQKYDKQERKVFFLVGLLYTLFLTLRIISNKYYLVDSYEYLEIAKKISSNTFFNNDLDYTLMTKRPFFYPLFFSFFIKFNIVFCVVFQTLISMFSIVFLFDVLKYFGLKIKPTLLFFLVLTPSIFIYTQLIMSEWLLFFLLNLLFWIVVKGWSKQNFIYIQIVTILLAFTKPVFYPFIYVNFLFFIVYFYKKKVFSLWLFLPILVLYAYLNFNQNRTGYKHFSSIENINLINYNLYYFKSNKDSKIEANKWKDSVYNEAYYKMNFKEQSEYLNKVGKREISKNIISYSFFHFKNALLGLFDPGRFDIMTFLKKENGKQGFLEVLNGNRKIESLFSNSFVWIYVILIPIFFFSIIKWFYFFKGLAVLKSDLLTYYMLVILFYYILITGPINCSRFMMPLQGIVLVYFIAGFQKAKKHNFLN